MTLSLNVINSKKKGKVRHRTFNLFCIDERTSILYEANDMIEPIIWATKVEMGRHLRYLDKIIENGKDSMEVTVYTYKWANNGWTLFTGMPWIGKISDINKKPL